MVTVMFYADYICLSQGLVCLEEKQVDSQAFKGESQ